MSINHEALEPVVKRVAQAVHASFPRHFSMDDTEQTLWLWVFENQSTVDGIIRNTERSEGVLYNLMTKVANEYLKKEDRVAYGYSEEDVFTYSLSAIKTALETVFDYEDWQSFSYRGDGQPRAKTQANMTGDHIAMMIDVKIAVERLPEEQYNTILWTYKYHYTHEQLGMELGISSEAARKRVERAVGAVQRRLGSKSLSDMREPLYQAHNRSKMTTAEGVYTSERQYEG